MDAELRGQEDLTQEALALRGRMIHHRGMATQTIDGISELKALVGKDFSPGPWKTLAFADIKSFADATGDHQWIHVDRERALEESPFKAPIAHGYYTLSRISALFFEVAEMKGMKGAINYGLNKVRFPAPLKEGASYRLAMSCASVTDVTGGVECLFKATVEIKDEAKPACVAELIFRYFV
jgi:acyl dehydratase